MAAKRKIVQGLRRRWITGSIGPVVVILLLVGVLISVGFASNYYNSAKSTLRAKAAAGADYFNTYVMTSYREYYRSATLPLRIVTASSCNFSTAPAGWRSPPAA